MAKIKIEKQNKTSKVKTSAINKKLSKSKAVKNAKLILKERLTSAKQEENSIFNDNLVKLAIEGLFKLTKETVNKKLFEEEYPILLQVTLIKIPNCADRIIRLPLNNSLVTDSTEVCLIVPDLKKGRRVDYEPTVEHYENLLRENKVNNINKIIPMNSIKTEYDQFELKRRLISQYDYFLADGTISGHLSHLLGKVFYTKRKLPTPVHLTRGNIKASIESALKKTQMHIHSKGNTLITEIGSAKMKIDDIVSNVSSVVKALNEMLPGGWDNIRSLHLKTHLSIAIPIYMTLKSSNDIHTPKRLSKKPKLSVEVEGELSTLDDVKVKVLPTGDIIV